MSTQRYSVTPHSIETILTWVKSGEIAIPEIQRPFVWNATKVRNLLDSLYLGYPVGYLIAWRNPSVKLKDGSSSSGKRILIDGQQRVTALMAAILGKEVLTKDYEKVYIKIAFNPIECKFEVANPAIMKDSTWIYDIADVFSPESSLIDLTDNFIEANPDVDKREISRVLEKLRKILNNHVGVIELDGDLDIETVTEIFIRVNSAGAQLSQADFAMSKISVNEIYEGNTLRKAIDYFCHMAVHPEFYSIIQKNDLIFSQTDFFQKMAWLKSENDDIYDPKYTDMLRVAFTTEFKRGKLQDLVALVSGRNFETKQFEEEIIEDSFRRLKGSIMNFMNETHFKRFIMIIRSAGFVASFMIGSQNALNSAYIVYLTLRAMRIPDAEIESSVRKWFVFSILTGRYSGSPESTFDFDIKQIHIHGFATYAANLYSGELSEAFWSVSLPQQMDTSASSSPYFRVFEAAQVKLGDRGFLSKDLSVRELVEVKSDVHHLFPRDFLKKNGLARGQYNQIANYVVAQSEINIAIGNKEPTKYMTEMIAQCNGGEKKYGNITSPEELKANLEMNCIPEGFENMGISDYSNFLEKRRKLMALRISKYFKTL
ncbi:MAG: DUF262 domain-containing protein [Candidatus Delongbacteria bacterium]|jgi:hypothetical protein|nr:DUF262 domain-containing protein [Candidatus Delongbacteria bacterium]